MSNTTPHGPGDSGAHDESFERVLPPAPETPASEAAARPAAASGAAGIPATDQGTAPTAPVGDRASVATHSPAEPGSPSGSAGAPPVPPLPPTNGSGAAFGLNDTLPHPQPSPAYQYAPTRPKAKVGAGKVAAILLAAAVVGGAAGLGGTAAGISLFAQDSDSPSETTSSSPLTINSPDEATATTAIAAKALPSVVTISASTSSGGGTGSGVVLSEDGYIVTNTHVVTLDGATGDASLRVTMSDGSVYGATIVGTDPVYDLAVIKVDGVTDLTPIEFGDSTALNVGDTTVAVGAPLGLSNTVTTGIVSALNRSIEIASSAAPEGDSSEGGGNGEENEQDQPFQFDFGQGQQQQQTSGTISVAVIQTDAAINPGNSGGALVDDEGKLIGINVAIATASGTDEAGSIGVGFAIPSAIVERVTDEIIAGGTASHGLLGASVSSASAETDATTTGALIQEVTPGGAAEEAGLQAGDVVTEFGGVRIGDQVDLTAQVRAHAAGDTVSLTYERDGQSQTVEVTLGELDL